MTDTAKTRIHLAFIAVLLVIIGAMAYKFIVARSTEKTDDGRLAIVLQPAERDLLLREMRDFVAGLQKVADALSRDDMKAVADATRGMGTARSNEVPAAMMGKLPLEFKTLALGVHHEFDAIALDAEALGMPGHTLGQLAGVLQKCVACHGSYQVKAARTQ